MNKNVFLWSLYDLANTPLTVAITGLYLAQWIVIDNKIPDLWYSGTFIAATILLLITSPFWGAWSDKIGKRMPFITWSTILMVIFGLLLSFVATSSLAVLPKVSIVLVFFFILQYLYQVSLISYDALLVDISTLKNRGHISGIGHTFGEAGWLIGPILLLPFAEGQITLFGTPGRAQVFLPAVLLLVLLGLPMLLWFKETNKKPSEEKHTFKKIYIKTIDGLKSLIRKDKNVALYLTAFMLISDAILTCTLFFGIFLDQVYQISDTQKVIILVLLEIFAIISAYALGKLSDQFGTKKILILSCLCMVLGFGLIAIFTSLTLLYIFVALAGIGIGGFYTTTRSFLIQISPVSRLGEYFGFYATFERFSSIIGPLIWGVATFLLMHHGILRYRVSILLLVILMMLGIILLLRVKETRAIRV